jgi:ectoine hydroxylase
MENEVVRKERLSDAPVMGCEGSVLLSEEQTCHYDQQGYLLLDELFRPSELERLRCHVREVVAERSERTVFEAHQGAVRSVYGIHAHHRVFGALARVARLVMPVRQVLRGEVYVYQSKLNTKSAFDGDQWPWHQDYVYWRYEDSMPAARALTAAVFLDDITELNGPMMIIPGSHRAGTLASDTYEGNPLGYEAAPAWIPNLTAKMKYTLPKDSLVRLTREAGIVAPKGRAGSVLLFDCNIAHASPPNLSHLGRTIALFTYNRVDNAPCEAALHRPDFLASRDTRPIVPAFNDSF